MTTPKLLMPELSTSQAQKEVTHNEGLRILDGLVQLSVVTRSNTPAASPVSGARYLVGASPTGIWAAYAGYIAHYYAGAWYYYLPREGWFAWVTDEASFYIFTTGSWTIFTAGGGSGGAADYVLTLQYSGLAALDDIVDGIKFPVGATVQKIFIGAREAPTGADVQIDILKNQVEQGKISTLTAGSKKETTAFLNSHFLTTEEFGLRIKQIGSILPGNELTIIVFVTLDSAAAAYFALAFQYSGLAILNDDIMDGVKLPANGTVTKIGIFAREIPTGSALTVDLLKNQVEQGIIATLADGLKKQLTDVADTALTTAQEIGLRIKSVGSTTPGAELTVILYGTYP